MDEQNPNGNGAQPTETISAEQDESAEVKASEGAEAEKEAPAQPAEQPAEGEQA